LRIGMIAVVEAGAAEAVVTGLDPRRRARHTARHRRPFTDGKPRVGYSGHLDLAG